MKRLLFLRSLLPLLPLRSLLPLLLLLPLSTAPAQTPTQRTYTSPDASLTFDYPAAWDTLSESLGVVHLTNHHPALISNEFVPTSVVVGVYLPAGWLSYGIQRPLTSPELMQAFAAEIAARHDPITLDKQTATVWHYHSNTLDGLIIGLPDSQIVIHAQMPLGERSQHAADILALRDSLTFDPTKIRLEGEYRGTLSFASPATATIQANEEHNWTFAAPHGALVLLRVTEAVPPNDFIQNYVTLFDSLGATISDVPVNDVTPLVVSGDGVYTLNIYNFSSLPRRPYTITLEPLTPIDTLSPDTQIIGEADLAFYALNGIGGQIVSLKSSAVVGISGPYGFNEWHFTDYPLNVVLPTDGQYIVWIRNFAARYTLNFSILTPLPINGQITATLDGVTPFYLVTGEVGTQIRLETSQADLQPRLQVYRLNGHRLYPSTDLQYVFAEAETVIVSVRPLLTGALTYTVVVQ